MAQTLSDIKALLAARGIHPRKRFGQNFLIDPRKLEQIVAAARLSPGDVVLEVGPGTGALTEAMLEAGARVVACEIDHDMCAILRERLGEHERFTLIEADVMAGKHELAAEVAAALGGACFKLVANLPYNIASPLLATLVLDHPAMTAATVMVQREVADRMVASPCTKDYGPLTVTLQVGCEAALVTVLAPGCFWPRPQVDSAVVRLERRGAPLTDDAHGVTALAQRLFQRRRKQIGSTLGRDLPYPEGIEPTMRAEQLSVEQFIALHQSIAIGH